MDGVTLNGNLPQQKYEQPKIVNKSTLYLLHQNIQSLRNKTLDVELLAGELLHQPKVLCFTEHWCTAEELESLNIGG